MKTFKELGISEEVLRAIEDKKFEKPSDIQEQTIPLVLAGRDIIGGSATGSGKTLAFGAGILQHSSHGRGIQALILTPTRELAEQVAKSLAYFSKYLRLNIISVYGGVSISPQIENLRHADIVVGTPGRILDHLERGTIELSDVKTLVLDEADRMLDMGFIDDVEKIILQCPKKRQTLMFSATIQRELISLAEKYMDNPESVSVESYVDPSLLKQVFYDVPSPMKFSALAYLLKKETADLVMVFCNTRMSADFVARNLRHAGIDALAVHGGFSQGKRESTLEKFHARHVKVLVCTDVAARGLDIKNVSHVYNYDSPKTSKEYIHRIGRTARAGKEGIAVSLVSDRDYENFSRVQDDRSMEITRGQLPNDIPRIEVQRQSFSGGGRFQRGGGGGYSRGRGGGGGYGSSYGSRDRSGYGGRSSYGNSRSEFRSRDDNRGSSQGRSRSEFRSRGEGDSRQSPSGSGPHRGPRRRFSGSRDRTRSRRY